MTSPTPKVSAVIPCYNAENVLANTIDSLLEQSVIPDEILVIDDGSSDESASIAQAYGDPVRVVTQRNQGAAVARHVGAVEAKHEIIVYIDAGDYAPPNKVQALSQALNKHPQCIASFGESWNTIKEYPDTAKFSAAPLDGCYTVVDDPFDRLIRHSFPITTVMNIAVRKKFAELGGNIGPQYKAGNDYAYQLSLSRFGPFVHVSEVTCHFKILPKGITDTFGIDQQMSFCLLAAVDFYHQHPDKTQYRKLFHNRISHYWPEITYFMWNHPNRSLRNEVIKIGLRYGNPIESLKAFFWTLIKEYKSGNHIKSPTLRNITKLLASQQ